MKRIVVIEDNPDNRLLLRAILEDRYAIADYETGTDGIAGIERDGADLVLCDVSLPGIDGVEVVRRLKTAAATGHIPVVALTAHAMEGDRDRFLAAGFDDYLTKPIVDEQVLFDVIERLAL